MNAGPSTILKSCTAVSDMRSSSKTSECSSRCARSRARRPRESPRISLSTPFAFRQLLRFWTGQRYIYRRSGSRLAPPILIGEAIRHSPCTGPATSWTKPALVHCLAVAIADKRLGILQELQNPTSLSIKPMDAKNADPLICPSLRLPQN